MSSHPPAAQTAFGPMVIAACERWVDDGKRILDDDLAVRFLPRSQQMIVRACRWPRVQRILVGATESKAHGLWASMLCRKRYADDLVGECLDAGIGQFVFLGAGLDTRPYRLVLPAGATAFEVDLPANVTYKREQVRRVFGAIPGNAHLIALDFERDDLGAALSAAGFDTGRPAMFIWEAVTQYLSDTAVRAVLGALRTSPDGSHLIFTYLRQDYLDGTEDFGAARARQDFVTKHRVWRFGIHPHDVGGLLDEYGWTEREQVGAAEYQRRYVDPIGRRMPVSEIERFVHATKSSTEMSDR